MRKIISKTVALFMAMTLVFSLSACNSSSGKTSTSSTASKYSTKNITLNVWMTPEWKGVFSPTEANAADGDFLKYAGAQYTKLHPNVTVNVTVIAGADRDTKLSVALQSGSQPNMFEESTFPMKDYVYQGAIVPIDDIITAADKKDIDSSVWKSCQVKGKTYFYPFSQALGYLMINEDVFKKAGLTVPDANTIGKWTPDEFLADLQAIKSKVPGVVPYALYCKNNQADTWNNALMRMFGAGFFKADGSAMDINNDKGVQAATFIQNLVKNGLTEAGPETQISNDMLNVFNNGGAAVGFGAFSNFTQTLQSMKSGTIKTFNIGLMNLPSVGDPITFSYVYSSAVFKNSDPDAVTVTKDFVKFFSSDPNYTKASLNFAPVRNSVWSTFSSQSPYYPAMQANTKYQIDFTGGIAGYNQFRAAFYPVLQALVTGADTPAKAVQDLQTKGNQVIKDALANSTLK
jgi:multiple sugar transport system substrate-binding protein